MASCRRRSPPMRPFAPITGSCRGPDTTIVPGTAIVLDAPPPHEDVGPYVAVAAMLRGLGLSAPEVMAEDRAEGFLLIEDFGDDTYTRLLSRGADERTLYALAIDALAALQQAVAKGGGAPDLPPYDTARLLAETGLFVDWYMPAVLGAPITAALREEYFERCGGRSCRWRRIPSPRPWCCAIFTSTT